MSIQNKEKQPQEIPLKLFEKQCEECAGLLNLAPMFTSSSLPMRELQVSIQYAWTTVL